MDIIGRSGMLITSGSKRVINNTAFFPNWCSFLLSFKVSLTNLYASLTTCINVIYFGQEDNTLQSSIGEFWSLAFYLHSLLRNAVFRDRPKKNEYPKYEFNCQPIVCINLFRVTALFSLSFVTTLVEESSDLSQDR